MKKLLTAIIILIANIHCTLRANDNQIKFPTEEEMQLMRDKMSDEEKQEAEKAANYFLTLINAAKDAGVEDGHSPTREQELIMMDAVFPLTKEEFLKKGKERVIFSKKCFSKANTLKKANECNQKANSISNFMEEDFTHWDEEKKKTTLKNINQFIPCIENASIPGDLSYCCSHIYK